MSVHCVQFELHNLLPTILFSLGHSFCLLLSVCATYLASSARYKWLWLGMPWRMAELSVIQSWPRFKSLYSGLADTRKIAQHCKATMFGHGRVCFLLILPRRNLFLMGTVLHLLRSCIAGRGLWGKPFNGGNYSWWKHLCGSLEFVEIALQPGDYRVKAGWRARDNLSLAQVASKKKYISPFHFCLHHCS